MLVYIFIDCISDRLSIYLFILVEIQRFDFNFPPRRGTGVARYLSHCSSDTVDLINQLCFYDPDHRISAVQALRHPYFDAIR
jgi:renal tumor antigen